jgi:DNA repair exonuclease SbcCD ATPase subunit
MIMVDSELRKKFLEARNYVLSNIFTIPEPSDVRDLEHWYNELDEKIKMGLIALSVERRLKYEPETDEWVEKIMDLLEGSCWWEDLDLACPMNLWEIVQEIKQEKHELMREVLEVLQRLEQTLQILQNLQQECLELERKLLERLSAHR